MAHPVQEALFPAEEATERGPSTERLPRLDIHPEIRRRLLEVCRLRAGQTWEDPVTGHRVGVLDASNRLDIQQLMHGQKTSLIINDPPYNVKVGGRESASLGKRSLDAYREFSRQWVCAALDSMAPDAHLYVWLGADYRDGFQPLPDFMLLLRDFPELRPRNWITMRNQRGFGTQKNWMWLRQELLYYVKGSPPFYVEAEYTDIPKVVRGYYKKVNGQVTENLQRGKSDNIRAGNVWLDIQQVFYRLEENVPGCYAQKPLKAIERIITAGSRKGELVVDCFAHSGTTLIAGEKLGRRVYTCDIDPVFAEIAIRRLEHYRRSGEVGWQWQSPFPDVPVWD